MEHYKFKVGDKIKKDGWGVLEWFEIKFIDLAGMAFGITQSGIGAIYYSSQLDDFKLYKEEPNFKEVTMYSSLVTYKYDDGRTQTYQSFAIYKTKKEAIKHSGSIGYIEQKVFLKDDE